MSMWSEPSGEVISSVTWKAAYVNTYTRINRHRKALILSVCWYWVVRICLFLDIRGLQAGCRGWSVFIPGLMKKSFAWLSNKHLGTMTTLLLTYIINTAADKEEKTERKRHATCVYVSEFVELFVRLRSAGNVTRMRWITSSRKILLGKLGETTYNHSRIILSFNLNRVVKFSTGFMLLIIWLMAGSCKHGNEDSVSVKSTELFFYRPINYNNLNRGSARWN